MSAPKRKPTVYLKGGFWGVLRPMPQPFDDASVKLWAAAHTWCIDRNCKKLAEDHCKRHAV